jgi:hypothetical protein
LDVFDLDPTAVMGAGHLSGIFRVLTKSDIASHGDHRTARVTVAAWDRWESER